MRRNLFLTPLVLVALAAVALVATHAHGTGGEPVTLEGEILDMACYVPKGAKGPEHANCAKACVKGGQPMGLLAADGEVYLLFANHEDGTAFEQAKEHAGGRVELVGVVSKRAGVNGLEVHSVRGL